MSSLRSLFDSIGAERVRDMQQNRQQQDQLFDRDRRMWGSEDGLRRQQLRESSRLTSGGGLGGLAFAEGGFVDPMMDPAAMDPALGLDGPPMGGMPMGGGGAMDMAMGQGGMGGGDPMMEAYQVYMQSAEEMGLPPIPFEEFAGMMADQLAEGGDMGMDAGDPAVGGKMVIDPDPNAPTDSIPATIDGEHPARLDSGEFVIPAHAVMFHGVDKLKKLIAQAEQAEQMP